MVTQNVISLAADFFQLSWKYLSKETLIKSSSTAYSFQVWILNFAALLKITSDFKKFGTFRKR